MKELIVLFACEASKGGFALGEENRVRVDALARYLRDNPGSEVFIGEQAAGYYGERGYSELVRQVLANLDIDETRIHSKGNTRTTLDEIIFAEEFLSSHPEFEDLRAMATRNQLPRTLFLWWWHCGRLVNGIPVRYSGPNTLWRTMLEPVKCLLAIAPAWIQRIVSDTARRFGVFEEPSGRE